MNIFCVKLKKLNKLKNLFYIASKVIKGQKEQKSVAYSILQFAIIAIALSIAVMVIAIAVSIGFKNAIRNEITGFASHIQIVNYDFNNSFETKPIPADLDIIHEINKYDEIRHIQKFAIKPGIIKTTDEIQGAVFKGVSNDFDWSFFNRHIKEGKIFSVTDTSVTNQVCISKKLAGILNLKVGDYFDMYFIDDKPRIRRFYVSAIYETSLEEFDKQFIIGDIKHVQKLNNWKESEITGYEVFLKDFRDINKYLPLLIEDIETKFLEDGSKLRVIGINDKYPQIFDWLELVDKNVWIVLTLMTIVASLNMISVLIILILEQVNLIGLLKALGAQDSHIQKIFLIQAMSILIKGVFLGNLIGFILCFLQFKFKIIKLNPVTYLIDYVPIELNLFIFIILNISVILIIYLIMFLPAKIISKISPSVIINYS